MAPHHVPLACASAFPAPSHRDDTTPSLYWAPHFMTQERIMFSNPTPSKPRLSRAATTCFQLSLRPCTAPLSCSLQPLPKLSLFDMRGVTVTDGGPLNSASKTRPMPCFYVRCLFTEHGSHYNSSLFCHESLFSSHVPRYGHPR